MSLREDVYRKCGGKCGYCGSDITVKSMQVDHIIPREYHIEERYGCHVNDMRNLMPSCRYCNNFKNTFTLEEFRKEIALQASRAHKYSVNYRTALRFGQITETPKPVVFYFEVYGLED
jgi:5-methylcytosine-specific restriction endonuclease McrA